MPKTFELSDSKNPFATVFKLAPIPMSISTLRDGTYIDVNEALLIATGYSRDEIVGRTARELQVYEDPHDFGRMRDLLSVGQGIRLEVRLRTKDGRSRTNLVTADIIDLKGEKCLLTASLDIEDRRQNESELQFLDDLGQRVMPLSDASEILRSTTEVVGQRFAVSVCAYADMEQDQDHFTIRDNWYAPDATSIVGHYSLAAFGERAVRHLRAGQPLVLCDNARELPAHEAKTFLDIGLAATICMPLVKNGRLTALMAIHDRVPRRWSEREQSLFREVTERSWAHIERVRLIEQLKESETRYRGAVITGRIAAWETDMVTRSRTWTEEGQALFGLTLADGRGTVGGPDDEFWNALHPADKHKMAEFHATADKEDSYPCEYRIVRPDGRVLWVSGRGRVVARGADGKAQRVANIVMDVTDPKLAEEKIVLLMREISHRSKNLLAVVQSIASQTVHTSQHLADFEDKFSRRLLSLAGSQDLLVKEDWKGVTLADLVHRQLEMFMVPGRQLLVEGPEVVLDAAASQAIGLALHELATNALKHGAWSTGEGKVTVSWSLRGQIKKLAWVETGGPPVKEPETSGFGTFLITTAVAETVGGDAVLEFAPDGLNWSLAFPSSQGRS